jgi:hypothetical protein
VTSGFGWAEILAWFDQTANGDTHLFSIAISLNMKMRV